MTAAATGAQRGRSCSSRSCGREHIGRKTPRHDNGPKHGCKVSRLLTENKG